MDVYERVPIAKAGVGPRAESIERGVAAKVGVLAT